MAERSQNESPVGIYNSVVSIDEQIAEAEAEEKSAWKSDNVTDWLFAHQKLADLRFKKHGERAKVEFRHD